MGIYIVFWDPRQLHFTTITRQVRVSFMIFAHFCRPALFWRHFHDNSKTPSHQLQINFITESRGEFFVSTMTIALQFSDMSNTHTVQLNIQHDGLSHHQSQVTTQLYICCQVFQVKYTVCLQNTWPQYLTNDELSKTSNRKRQNPAKTSNRETHVERQTTQWWQSHHLLVAAEKDHTVGVAIYSKGYA